MSDRPFRTPLLQALSKIAADSVARLVVGYYERELARLSRSAYDLILVVNGQTVHSQVLRRLRSLYPSAKLVLYMWDSIDNRPGVRRRLELFDDCFSFDPESSRSFRMHFRPLFFGPQFEKSALEAQDVDLSFVGTMHSDRYAVVSRLRRVLPPDLRCYWYLYLQAPWVLSVRKWVSVEMRTASPDEFRFAPLEKRQVSEIFWRSKAILDIEHPKQRGLTMRTFETMGARKKLITTNSAVREYDFYDPENIAVIDRDNPQIRADFFESGVQPLQQDLYRKYSLAGWVAEISSRAVGAT